MRPILIAIALLLLACASTKKQMERASAYEHGGMLQQAFDEYAALYTRRPNAVQAHLGMKRAAQGLFDRSQGRAMSAYTLHDLDAGERERQNAIALMSDMARYRLDLQWDARFENTRQEAMRTEAVSLYDQAQAAFREDRFTDALDLAERAGKLDPQHRDAIYLARLAKAEPLYREAARSQDLGLWREAYRTFHKVADIDAGHRDVLQRLTTCREKAAFTVAYVPLYNGDLYPEMLGLPSAQIEEQFAANLKQEVLDLHDPLIMLVERDNSEEVLAEQRRVLSGVYDDRYVAETGKLLGAHYVLTGKILRFDDVLRKEIEVQIQLLDVETGRIRMAEIVRVNKQEIARGAPRAQLLQRAAKRAAIALAEFDPTRG